MSHVYNKPFSGKLSFSTRLHSVSAPKCTVQVKAAPLIDPITTTSTAFAPATVANLGPGFDWMGCAVEAGGDTVVAKVLKDSPGKVVIERIEGDNGRLTLDPTKNCVGVAALETLKLIGQVSAGVSLTLYKGLPLGSGLGSSAASAAAAAVAVNGLFGSPVSREALVTAGLASEATVSGYHADNVGPAILGGFVLIRNCKLGEPLQLIQLPLGASAAGLHFVLVNPVFEAPTAKMRAALGKTVPFPDFVHNCRQGGVLVTGIMSGDISMIGSALDSDIIIEAARAPLIPGMREVKEAAKAAGAYGATISGAGPTAVAIVDDPEVGMKVAEAMSNAFRKYGKLEVNTAKVVRLDSIGAKLI